MTIMTPIAESSSSRAVLVALLLTTMASWIVKPAQARGGSQTQTTTTTKDLPMTQSCRLVTFLPFTDLRKGPDEPHANPNQYGYGNYRDEAEATEHARSLLAAAEMARQDFNTRNARLVPELTELTAQCTVQLTDDVVYLDSAHHRATVVRQFLEQSNNDAQSPVCAVVGPIDYQAHAGLAPLTETYGIPQVAYATLDNKMSRTDYFPNFVRLIPTGTSMGETLPIALFDNVPGLHWQRAYVANIYEEDFGEQFENPIEDAEDEFDGYHTLTESYTPGDEESLWEALSYVTDQGDGFRTVLLTIDQWAMMDDIARVGAKLGVTGSKFLWAVTGDALPATQLQNLELTPGEPLDVLLDGLAVFTHGDPFHYATNPAKDPFIQAWRTLTATDVQNVWQRQPENAQGGRSKVNTTVEAWPREYFQTTDPALYASYIYDAVMAVGLSKCRQQQAQEAVTMEPSLTHVEYIKRLQFSGASGPVSFMQDDDGNPGPDRDPAGVIYGWHNIRPTDVQANGKRKYEMVLVAKYETVEGEGRWISNGEEFIFHGGTKDEPRPYIAPNKFNHLSDGTQALGFVLVAVSLTFSIGSALWLIVNREERLVKASQPEFLVAMCFGAALVAISLVFISFDENKDWSESKLSKACATFPWFFILGYEVQYCALVCKLWRLSKLLQMRRRTVAVKQVLLPFAVVMFGILAVMTIWTIQDPLQWERDFVGDNPRNTYGRCEMANTMATYLAPLGTLVFSAMCSTAYLCWTLRDVQPDLAESRWIFLGIFGHLQIWAIGIPLLIIAEEMSRDVSYIMSAALCFVFSTTLVCSLVWPKIFVWTRDKYFGGDQSRKLSFNTTGQGSTRVSGLNFPAPKAGMAAARAGESNSFAQANSAAESTSLPKPRRQSHNSGDASSDIEPLFEEDMIEGEVERAPPETALPDRDTEGNTPTDETAIHENIPESGNQ